MVLNDEVPPEWFSFRHGMRGHRSVDECNFHEHEVVELNVRDVFAVALNKLMLQAAVAGNVLSD